MRRALWAKTVLSLGLMAGVVLAQTPGTPPQTSLSAAEKQKKLAEDSETLVRLTAELKVSVEKSNKNELSLDVIRKAEAVEKLAKSVKERLREAR